MAVHRGRATALRTIVVRGAGLVLAVVLFASAGAKILTPLPDALLPPAVANVVAIVEAVCALALVFERGRRPAAWVVAVLATLFVWAMVYYVAVGADVRRCGCFGGLEMSLRAHVGAIGGMLLLAAVATRDVRQS